MDYVLQDEFHDSFLDDPMQLFSSSDDDSDDKVIRRGSRAGRSGNIERGRESAALRLHNDYFAPTPTYTAHHFQRRFRISRSVFDRIIAAIPTSDIYFVQREDCTKRKGFTCHQKATAALRLLAYGITADSVDEYIRMAEPTALECLKRFARAVISCFGARYVRAPDVEDVKKILCRSAWRGFPGMLGSIDCCKWTWKNCPTAHHGQYQGKEGVAAMTLEAIADDRLWIWHMFFGMPGCANDINVLDASPLSNKMAEGKNLLPVEYVLPGQKRSIPYWLADGIYPKWLVFVQTVANPTTQKEKLLSAAQEAAKKDVERAFGVLQGKWHILSRPSRLWRKQSMKDIMKCCVILHNMMAEYRDEEDAEGESHNAEKGIVGEGATELWALHMEREQEVPPRGSIAVICGVERLVRNRMEYFKTRELIMEHLWQRLGRE